MITRDATGAVILIETSTATMRVSAGVWYGVLTTADGGEVRLRIDPDLGLSSWHRPREQPIEPIEPIEPLPNNILKLERKS